MRPPKRIPNSRVLEENELQALVPTEGGQRPVAGVGHGAVITHGLIRTKENVSGDNTAELQGHIKPWEHRELSEHKV